MKYLGAILSGCAFWYSGASTVSLRSAVRGPINVTGKSDHVAPSIDRVRPDPAHLAPGGQAGCHHLLEMCHAQWWCARADHRLCEISALLEMWRGLERAEGRRHTAWRSTGRDDLYVTDAWVALTHAYRTCDAGWLPD